MLEKLGKFKLIIVGALVSLLFIVITISQFQKRQETRSRAAGEAISVILNPLTQSVNVGSTLNVAVTINGAQNNISAVDITFSYDANLLGNPTFQPATTFTTIINNAATPGTIHFVGVNPTSNAIIGSSINIGTISLNAKAAGTATIGFSNIHVNASGVAGALPVDTNNTKNGTYTIGGSQGVSPSPIPTIAPTGKGGQTTVELSLQLTGVGANSSQGLNNNPKHSQRNVEMAFFSAQNQNVLSTIGTVTYNDASGLYKGSVLVNLPTGAYIIKVRLDNTLWRQIPGIQNIDAGSTNQTPTAILISGDINHDNEINLIDYNLFVACLAHVNVCNN